MSRYFGDRTSLDFCVCYQGEGGDEFLTIPSNNAVKDKLEEMLDTTCDELGYNNRDRLELYDISEKYGSSEKLKISDEGLNTGARSLWEKTNLDLSTVTIDVENLIYYFVRYVYGETTIIAVRKATYFKGVLRHRNKLVSRAVSSFI